VSYDVHGLALGVSAAEPAVLGAMDQRLLRFRAEPGAPAEIRFEFLAGAPSPAPGGRPVYDTPYGQLHYSDAADTLWGELAGVHLRCEAAEGVARVHSTGFDGRQLYLATHPLATVSLMELFERRGRFSLHAACLARGDEGVLLAGPTGSGKSTLTLALLRAGLQFVSDDVIFLERVPAGGVRVLGFPDAVGVTADTAARFPELAGAPLDIGFPKWLVRIEDAFPAAPAPLRCTPRALVFPHVVRDRAGELRALDPKEAWLRLVPDVLLTHPAATSAHLQAIAALLGEIRCYELASGTDLAHGAQLVADLL
jgi:hypothetical protein